MFTRQETCAICKTAAPCEKALGYAVRNVTVSKRNTMLKERLQRIRQQKAG